MASSTWSALGIIALIGAAGLPTLATGLSAEYFKAAAGYPSVSERRDNIKMTVAALEQRLAGRAQQEQAFTAAQAA